MQGISTLVSACTVHGAALQWLVQPWCQQMIEARYVLNMYWRQPEAFAKHWPCCVTALYTPSLPDDGHHPGPAASCLTHPGCCYVLDTAGPAGMAHRKLRHRPLQLRQQPAAMRPMPNRTVDNCCMPESLLPAWRQLATSPGPLSCLSSQAFCCNVEKCSEPSVSTGPCRDPITSGCIPCCCVGTSMPAASCGLSQHSMLAVAPQFELLASYIQWLDVPCSAQ